MWVGSSGGEDPLEKGIATHSNIAAWKMPWTEEPGTLQSLGSQRVGHNTQVKRFEHASEAFRIGQEVLPLFPSKP